MLSRGHWFLLAAASAEALLDLTQILSFSYGGWRPFNFVHYQSLLGQLWQYNSFLWLIAAIICTYPPPRKPVSDDTTELPTAPDWHDDRLRTVGMFVLLGLAAGAAARLLSWLTKAGVSNLTADQYHVLIRFLYFASDIGVIAIIDFHRRRSNPLRAITARRCSTLALLFYSFGAFLRQITLIRSLDRFWGQLALFSIPLTMYVVTVAGLTLLAIAASLTARRLSRLSSTIEGQP
jgi:hypothetical protein